MSKITLLLEAIGPMSSPEEGLKEFAVRKLDGGCDYLLTYRLAEINEEEIPLIVAIRKKVGISWHELDDTEVQNELGITVRRGEQITYPARVVFQILSVGLSTMINYDDDDSGGSGVREPLGPHPVDPSAAATVTPDEVVERRAASAKSVVTK